MNKNFWFDGDSSERYFAEGHVSKEDFAAWIQDQDEEPVSVDRIEYKWALDKNEESFVFVDEGTEGSYPITCYSPY